MGSLCGVTIRASLCDAKHHPLLSLFVTINSSEAPYCSIWPKISLSDGLWLGSGGFEGLGGGGGARGGQRRAKRTNSKQLFTHELALWSGKKCPICVKQTSFDLFETHPKPLTPPPHSSATDHSWSYWAIPGCWHLPTRLDV